MVVVQSTTAGPYQAQLYVDETPIGDVQSAVMQPGSPQLNRCQVLFADGAADVMQTLTVAQTAMLVLAGSDKYGNLLDLAEYFQVTCIGNWPP